MKLQDTRQAQAAALAAINFTRETLANGNDNPYAGVPASHLRIPQRFATEEVIKKRSVRNYAAMHTGNGLQITLCDAKIAKGAKCGNCDEHASVAFAYLFVNGFYPIYKYCFPVDHGDHCFVVLGPPDTPDAVICDPWANCYLTIGQRGPWKSYIWGTDAPDDKYLILKAQQAESAGTEQMYQQITQYQEAYDAMDMS